MKFFIFVTLLASTLFSKVYYSKVAPYQIRDISSNVSGLVTSTNENMLGKKLDATPYITIDSTLDVKELHTIKEKIQIYKNTLKTNQKILKNMQALLVKKETNYQEIKDLKIKSRIEKDREFYDLITSKNSYLATQKEIHSLQIQLADLQLRQAQLEKSIHDKKFTNSGFTLYALYVKQGQVVTPSVLVAKIADTSKALLTIYLDAEDVEGARKKVIYINKKKTPYTINRLQTIADSTNISKYKAQIIIKAPKTFSQLAQIELKDE